MCAIDRKREKKRQTGSGNKVIEEKELKTSLKVAIQIVKGMNATKRCSSDLYFLFMTGCGHHLQDRPFELQQSVCWWIRMIFPSLEIYVS